MNRVAVNTQHLTPQDAYEMAAKASKNTEIMKEGVRLRGSLESVAIMYHSAQEFNIRIREVVIDDKRVRLSRKIKQLRQDDWLAFQEEQQALLFGAKQEMTPVIERDHHGSDALEKLNGLTGLQAVKTQIGNLADLMKVMKAREAAGLKAAEMGQHLVFTGNPGTGKTTVARLVGEAYRDLGVLRKGQFIEVGGRDLIAEYIGHTAAKVDGIVEQALDGILFIDEAYALVPQDSARDFGPEAVAALIRHMENHRNRLVVIVAGYEDEMNQLLNSNPGLKSRFKTKIEFPDYSAGELFEIFEYFCREEGYELALEARKGLAALCEDIEREKGKNFGNGRTARNIFDKMLMNQACRIARLPGRIKKEVLQSLHSEDIPEIGDIEW